MNVSNIAQQLGKRGGKKTSQLYGKNHYIEAQKKSVKTRLENKKKISTYPPLTTASK